MPLPQLAPQLCVSAASGEALRALLASTQLESVYQISLTGNNFTAEDIATLKALPHLKKLAILCTDALPTEARQTIGELSQLTALDLSTYKALTEDDLAIVATLPNLHTLNLENRSVVTDKALSLLAQATQLRELNLDSCAITDKSAALFASLSNLRHLILNGNRITDTTLQALPTPLTTLGLARCVQITSTGVADMIAAMPGLQVLHLTLCGQLSNEVLTACGQHLALRELYAARVPFDDAGLQSLSQLKTLEKVILKLNRRITDKGIGELAALSSLSYLDLTGCLNVTARSFVALGKNGASPLRTLVLEDCPAVDDAALLAIGNGMPALENIVLDGCRRISANGMEGLARSQEPGQMKKLQSLSIAYCNRLDDNAMKHIGTLINMRSLNIANCTAVTKIGLTELLPLFRLEEFVISGCALPDDAMAMLTGFPSLHTLIAEQCNGGARKYPQTDTTVSHLAQIASLRLLKLTGNLNITRPGILQLCGLPHLRKLYFYPSAVPLDDIKDDFPNLILLHSGPMQSRAPGNKNFLEHAESAVTQL